MQILIEMSRTQRCALCHTGLVEICTMSLDKLDTFSSNCGILWKLMHIDSVSVRVLSAVRFGRSVQRYRPPRFFFFLLAVSFSTLLSMVVSKRVHNLTSQSKITWCFGRAISGTILKQSARILNSEKAAWEIFLASFIVRTVFYTYQTKKIRKKNIRYMHFKVKV